MNRRQRRALRHDPIAASAFRHLHAAHGQRIPGGCPDCNAYQTLDVSAAPLYQLTVHHDDTCPTYNARRPRQ